jgi:hypothetical protein
MPMDGRVFRQLVGDEDADLVALDGLDRRTGGLPVIAPKMGDHAGRDFPHHLLGNQVELLPIAIHLPRSRPTIERYDGLILGPACGKERRLHDRLFHRRRFRDRGCLDASRNRPCTDESCRPGGPNEGSTRD